MASLMEGFFNDQEVLLKDRPEEWGERILKAQHKEELWNTGSKVYKERVIVFYPGVLKVSHMGQQFSANQATEEKVAGKWEQHVIKYTIKIISCISSSALKSDFENPQCQHPF